MKDEALPLRTRVFGLVERLVSRPVPEADDATIVERREKRARLQTSRIGRALFGRIDSRCSTENLWVDLGAEGGGEPMTRLRVYAPSSRASAPLPAVVMFHGGGWVQGDPEQNDWVASRIAVRTPCVVASVAYRLAPEHPFPAAVDDCWAALCWVMKHATDLGVDPACVRVMGDSAGGNLAAVVALLAREANVSVRAQVLVYPSVEMIDEYDSERRHAIAPVLTSAGMRAFARIYLAGADGTRPTASPLRAASHAGLAPALIQTAGHDPLLDNGRLYAERLAAAGVPVTYTCYGDCLHGFLSLPGVSPSASTALDEVVAFVRGATTDSRARRD